MYIPEPFVEADPEAVLAFLKTYPFGTMTGMVDGRLLSVHLPVTIPPGHGSLRLQAHIAKANSLSHALDGQEVLLHFLGPHSYVSPSWYTHDKQYPTWIYAAVHVQGRVRMLGADALERQVEQLVAEQEARVGSTPPWTLERVPIGLTAHLASMIAGFEIEITEIEACFKLNQHKRAEDVAAMAQGLRSRGQDALADMALSSLRRVDTDAVARYLDKYRIPEG